MTLTERARVALCGAVLVAPACRGSATTNEEAAPAAPPPQAAPAKPVAPDKFSRSPMPAEMTDLGRQLFSDTTLSASGQMACVTCHDPKLGFGPPNARPTQLGGPDMKSPGLRAVPSLRYLQSVPSFTQHYLDEASDGSNDVGPTGGNTWDGRVNTKHDQAKLPLTSKFEMANASLDDVVAKVAGGPLATKFRAVFGDDVFANPARGSAAILMCLEVFQQSPKDFYPYSSKYDQYLRRKAELSAAEARGLALYNDGNKGNCASCHPSGGYHGAFPQFTDYGFNALGVPRNARIAANADPRFYDMGLCGPERTDLKDHKEYCGLFRVPSLRNVALRKVFFHNGAFDSLDRVMAFYVERDTNPGKWYPKVGGKIETFDDLPAELRKNVTHDVPFGGKPGGKPRLSATEIRDVIAFLKTLTDADLQEPTTGR
ncbi:MAG TPA: cytochrome c peroxidase [Polyangia bacterium]|nr:cytochrome c peroxidase [Polyangia bacterium]